jgi:hypothetical protein
VNEDKTSNRKYGGRAQCWMGLVLKCQTEHSQNQRCRSITAFALRELRAGKRSRVIPVGPEASGLTGDRDPIERAAAGVRDMANEVMGELPDQRLSEVLRRKTIEHRSGFFRGDHESS